MEKEASVNDYPWLFVRKYTTTHIHPNLVMESVEKNVIVGNVVAPGDGLNLEAGRLHVLQGTNVRRVKGEVKGTRERGGSASSGVN